MTDLRQRVFAAIAAEPSLPRPAAERRRAAMLAIAGLVSLIVFVLLGGARPGDSAFALWACTAVGAPATAGTALALALTRGGSMLGRSAPFLIGLALATPILLFLWKAALSTSFGMTQWVDARPGFRCLGLALSTGVVPFLVFLSLWRRTAPTHPRLTGLALGTAAGAAAWVLVDLWCSVGNPFHLLLGHVLPLAILAAAGAVAGRVLLPRFRPSPRGTAAVPAPAPRSNGAGARRADPRA